MLSLNRCLIYGLLLMLGSCGNFHNRDNIYFECGKAHKEGSSWSLLLNPPQNSEELLALTYEGKSVKSFLTENIRLDQTAWFQKGSFVQVCKFSYSETCKDFGVLATFDVTQKAKVIGLSDIVCVT